MKGETSATNLSSSLPVWVQCCSIRWEVTSNKEYKSHRDKVSFSLKLILENFHPPAPFSQPAPHIWEELGRFKIQWVLHFFFCFVINSVVIIFNLITIIMPSPCSPFQIMMEAFFEERISSLKSKRSGLKTLAATLIRILNQTNDWRDYFQNNNKYLHLEDNNNNNNVFTLRMVNWFLRIRTVKARLCFSILRSAPTDTMVHQLVSVKMFVWCLIQFFFVFVFLPAVRPVEQRSDSHAQTFFSGGSRSLLSWDLWEIKDQQDNHLYSIFYIIMFITIS